MFKAKPILQATMLPERKAIYLSIVDAAVQVGIRVHSVYSLFSNQYVSSRCQYKIIKNFGAPYCA